MTSPFVGRAGLGFEFRQWAWLGASGVVLALAACGGGDDEPAAVQIRTLSNRADLISGGNALVEIVPPNGVSATGLSVKVGARDVTSSFAQRADGSITGVIDGLADGDNVVVAQLDNARAAS